MDSLKKLRDRIDWLDAQIASLLNERMKAGDQIGRIKQETQSDITDSSREKYILEQVETIVQHPILKANISNIYRDIMQESKTAQQFFFHFSQPFRKVGIIGMGLIGGSICKGIKMKNPLIEINTLVHDSEDNFLAQREGWINHAYTSMSDLLQNTDLIIIASPISTIVKIAEEITCHAVSHNPIIVIDIASVKEEIVEAFEKLSCENIEYIGTHPMSGKEIIGFANSQATLFVDKPWIIVPHKKNSSKGIDSIKELIHYLGAKPHILDAKAHDQQAALVSHLPMILAKSYFDFVNSLNPESLAIAGPGFQSFTRIAHHPLMLLREITKYNQQFIHNYLEKWLEYVQENNR